MSTYTQGLAPLDVGVDSPEAFQASLNDFFELWDIPRNRKLIQNGHFSADTDGPGSKE